MRGEVKIAGGCVLVGAMWLGALVAFEFYRDVLCASLLFLALVPGLWICEGIEEIRKRWGK